MYLYLINRPPNDQKSLAELECLTFTGIRTDKNYVISSIYADIRHSAYIDYCIDLYFIMDNIEDLYKSINSLNYCEDRFRVNFINVDEHLEFKARKDIERTVSDIFPSDPDLKEPLTEFIVTKISGKWMFGKLSGKTEKRWLLYYNKPHTFCNALPSRMARALVNIACQNKKDIKLLDPCCGMGTVLLEAFDMGIDSYGYDINSIVVENANKNLDHFNFPKVVESRDAAQIKGQYDVSVIDLPYGVLSIRGSDKYKEIIGNVRKLCSRSVILSSRDISDLMIESGFKVMDGCVVRKGGLSRHITVCE